MLDINGTPKLMDMGISKTISEETNGIDGIVGTPYYISPEQARKDKDIDFRSDLYSLGATLYHMVTGEVPFDADTLYDIMVKHTKEPLIPPRDRNRTVSKNCSDLIRIMMTKSPWQRHSTWEYLISDIDMVLSGRPPAGIDLLAQKEHAAEERAHETESERMKRVLSESTEINLNPKMTSDLIENNGDQAATLVDRKPAKIPFKTVPPKRIKPKAKWRNWIFFIILIIILIAIGIGIWLAVKKTKTYLTAQPPITTEQNKIQEPAL
jgi:serine/threonine protein kinase